MDSPGIAIFDFDDTGTHPWLVMEYVDGQSLTRLIKDRGRLEADTILPIFAQAAEALARLAHRPALAAALPEAAAGFAASPEKSARRFLLDHAVCGPAYATLPSSEDKLTAELALTWEATRRCRQACVAGLLPFAPLIAGDAAWDGVFPGVGRDWRRIHPLAYYDELPQFYRQSDISLNTTSQQMKGAVNQRVFDVPACGGFVLTDAREQLGRLFDLGRETAVYSHPGEIGDMVRHYLAHPAERTRLSQAARQRILARTQGAFGQIQPRYRGVAHAGLDDLVGKWRFQIGVQGGSGGSS